MSIQAIIDRVAADPDFLARLQSDPAAVAQAEGYAVDEAEVRAALQVGADDNLAEALQDRLSKSENEVCY